ncbi:efflux RND transporter permease subunit [Kushneria indalinina]|uniref:Multidrug efflux pump subunit AcrB n=1 Tax=Kushneria indalinina DSM 14324 TaxID=1122140 RepID=A0A3D9DYH8_9GAMM|nr:efflux RND transporter permease subunit [Kushneria indalinina]REC95399.1 multidrug efflux pump subunit AcrB [Kushneria indalinina DSM 14324]
MTTPTPPPAKPERKSETPEVRSAHPLMRFFFLKPIFAVLLTLTLLMGGLFAYSALVQEALPDLDIPQASITTAWPGADPRSVEGQITDPIEDEITTLSGVKSVNSASFDSLSTISIEFEASSDTVDAMTRLRAAVADAESSFPSDVESPRIRQSSVDDRPIMSLALHGNAGAATLNQTARQIRDALERVQGVNEVNIGGEREDIVQILLNPERLLALGVSPTAIRDAVQQANIEQPFGEVRSQEIGAVVRLEGRFSDIEDLRALPISRLENSNSSRALTLGEVATVKRMQEAETSRAFFSERGDDYQPSLDISITKSPGADTVQLVARIRAALADLEASNAWSDQVHYSILQDGGVQIQDSLSEVFGSALQTMLVVFAILFITISWREAIVAGLAVPVTFAGVLLVILMFGYSLNELVIIGMVIALVMIIDIFIILMEGLHDEIHRNGRTFGQAALITVRRYAVPVFAAQITTLLALAPLMSIGGTMGAFVRVLPTTIIICLVLSFIVAMLCAVPLSRVLLGRQTRSSGEKKPGMADRVTQRAVDGLERWSSRYILASRRQSWLWVAGAAALFLVSIVAFSQARLELFPASDGERLGINIELPPTVPLETSQLIADEVGDRLREKPFFESVTKLVGLKSPFAGGSAASSLQPSEAENFIGFSVMFKSRDQRDEDSWVLADTLRTELADYLRDNVAGAELLVVPESSGPSAGDPIEMQLIGGSMDTLKALSLQVQEVLSETNGVVDVRDNLGAPQPQLALQPNREALSFFGITHDELAAQVRIAFSSDIIGTFATSDDQDDIDIRLGTEWPSQQGEAGGPGSVEEFSRVRAYQQDGRSIAMFQLMTPVQSEGAIAISHVNGERALTVMAKNQGRTVTEIMNDVAPRLEALQRDWPPGYRVAIGGESAETSDTVGSIGIAMLVAITLVVGVLVIVFSSFRQALIIFATMPLAIIGTAIGFWAFGISFSFFAMIGLVSLIGIAINNGIIMVDTMNGFLREGMSVAEAAAAGAARRLRPLLTTALTTIVGLIPLAISSASYRPLTLVIIFGLVSATLLALFVVPALYYLLTPADASEAEVLD